MAISQALLTSDTRGVRTLAHTDGFDEPEAERIAVLFGPRPAGVACPLAHFACPFGKKRVAVVTVADRPDGSLGFRFLVLDRALYGQLGDPFAIADRFPPDWSAKGPQPMLEWPPEPLPPRRVDELQRILKTGDTSLLLGATQVLVDGGRVALKRGEPQNELIRGLWQLLPNRTRAELWPASFAFSDELGLDAVAMPEPPSDPARVRHSEDGLRDYPQSRYELNLQIAIESGDQRELDHLFNRRTSDETIRLGLTIIAIALALALVFKFV
ncbi:MAG: hypothetical protein U0791_03615 [Gemmataceae bacterium]